MAKRETNEKLITRLIRFSKHGALMQVFMLQNKKKYAAAVIEAGAEAVDSPMISGAAWHGVAAELKAELDSHFAK